MSMIVVLILTSVLLELGGLSDLFHGYVSDSYLRSILSGRYKPCRFIEQLQNICGDLTTNLSPTAR